MYEFEKLKTGVKVGWKPIRLSDGRIHAIIICPKCGEEVFLGNKMQGLHHIAEDGTVNPSIIHGNQQYVKHEVERSGVGCGWHDYIRLLGWAKL